ncbi:MAG TPA: hypothetical protein VK522_10280 [Pseudolabrys sp.]|nr:hypothetical protein [Pseudolabrys sp.]
MYADALLGILALSAFVFVFYGPWQAVCTDWARQTIFESRDELFDLARAGEMSFEAANYRAIRSSLNCLIRFAHEVSWVEFLALYLGLRRVLTSDLLKGSHLKRALDNIENEATRKKVARLVSKAQRAVVLMMAFKSLPLCVLLLATQVSSSIGKKVKPVARALREKVQLEAETICP